MSIIARGQVTIARVENGTDGKDDGTTGTSTIHKGEFYDVDATNCTAMGNNTFKVADKLNLVAGGVYTQQLNILLPNDTSFVGRQINIHNPIYALTRTSLLYENATIVRAEEGYIFYKPYLGSQTDLGLETNINTTSQIEFMAGTLTFLCVPGQGGTSNSVVRWLCLNHPSSGNVVYSYSFGTQWVRKYSDGWIEQGGRITQSGSRTVSFNTPFKNTNYTVHVNGIRSNSGASGYNHVYNFTTTSFYAVVDGGSGLVWSACGF